MKKSAAAMVRSPFGRSLAGIRERELRMKILGYNTWLHKYIAFIIAGGFGGLAGVLWAHTAGIVSPENVVLTTSVDALLMAVLGGAGTLVGSLVAVRAGRCVCAHDPVSAHRADGNPGANSPAAGAYRNSRRREENGTCDLLTGAGITTTRELRL